MKKTTFVIFIVLVVLFISRFSFAYWPEMLSRPYLMLHGWLPYRDIVMEHSPLLVVAAAFWYHLAGVGLSQLRLLTWMILGFNTWLVYRYMAARHGYSPARLAGVLYLVLAFSYQGNGLWYDLALAPLVFIAAVLALEHRPFLSGMVFVLAFFTKQTAVWILPALLWFVHDRRQGIVDFLVGVFSALGLVLIVMNTTGTFTGFFHWALAVRADFLWPGPGQLVYAFLPFSVLMLKTTGTSVRTMNGLRISALLMSMSAFPRWEVLHFQPGLPFLAVFASLVFSARSRIPAKAVVVALASFFVLRQGLLLFTLPDRFNEPDFRQAAAYVSAHTLPSDRILVLNTWESLYALSDRLPASRPLYPYLPWYLDLPEVQEDIITGLKDSPPRMLVVGEIQGSGLGAYIPQEISSYLGQKYAQKVKIGEVYVWQ